MFLILPLGLRGLPIRVPFITICLIVATCWSYYFQIKDSKLMNALEMKKSFYLEFTDLHQKIFLSVCAKLKSQKKIPSGTKCLDFAEKYKVELEAIKKPNVPNNKNRTNLDSSDSSDSIDDEKMGDEKNDFLASMKSQKVYLKVADHYFDVIIGKSNFLDESSILKKLEIKRDKYLKLVANKHKKNNIFSGVNRKFQSAFMVMFRHGSLAHLIGNMIFLFFLGIYLESALGLLGYLGIYTLAGIISSYGWSMFSTLSVQPLVGASGAISGMMGVFFVIFYHHEIRMLATILIKSKIFYMPVKFSIPIFFVAQDLTSAFFSKDNVANSAHIIGFIVGMGISYIFLKKQRFPFLYAKEYKEYKRLSKKKSIEKVYPLIINLLKVNPNNFQVRDHFIYKTFEEIYSKNKISKNIKYFLKDNLDISLAMAYKRNDKKTMLSTLIKIPLSMKFQIYLRRVGYMTVLYNAENSLKHKEYLTALRLYDLFLIRFPRSSQTKDVLRTANAIIDYMIINNLELERLERYYKINKRSLTLSSYQDTLSKYWSKVA